MKDASDSDAIDEWSKLWGDDSGADIDAARRQFDRRRKRSQLAQWLAAIAIGLGFVLTISFLVVLPVSASIIVLVAFCWVVWGLSGWAAWQLRRAKQAALAGPPSEFAALLRDHLRMRRKWLSRGWYIIAGVGVFLAGWSVWFLAEHWQVYRAEPWRAVVGLVGMVAAMAASVYLHRRERSRVDDEAELLSTLVASPDEPR